MTRVVGNGRAKANHEDADERSKDKEGRLGSSHSLVAITKEVWFDYEDRVSSKRRRKDMGMHHVVSVQPRKSSSLY